MAVKFNAGLLKTTDNNYEMLESVAGQVFRSEMEGAVLQMSAMIDRISGLYGFFGTEAADDISAMHKRMLDEITREEASPEEADNIPRDRLEDDMRLEFCKAEHARWAAAQEKEKQAADES